MNRQLELDLQRSSERERELQMEVASLRAQLGGIKLYADEVSAENKMLRLQLKGVDKLEQGN
jgi:hypothetical protein